ncbi:hypothetical protein [Ralstonia phage RP12]|uniref:Uncharacterized protein n=1 Tax=Ralstonia phage RP12 TaxID=1923889 RepID=A0A1L7N116_9CAUD|nr:hypothetical protein FDH28_gp010 [Ralstonia phage RP12]BAW18984.1 hypothetical protein [Ralstonia phage RP12]
MTANNAIVVGYPNQIGSSGRYELPDQRTYFSKFNELSGGSSQIFELALQHVLDHDLVDYFDQCVEIFDSYYQILFDENTIDLEKYQIDRREFFRRTFDIYRYAKTSLIHLVPKKDNQDFVDYPFSHVKRLSSNCQFDSGTFLLR